MKWGIVIVGLLALFGVLISGTDGKWTDLRVTFGLNPFSSKNFVALPRTQAEADEGSWHQVTTDPPGTCENEKFSGIRYMKDGGDVGATILFDKNGIIAGIQMNLVKSEILTPDNKYKFDKVSMYQNGTIEGVDVYTLTAYFVNPDTICTKGRTLNDLKTQGTGTSLNLQNGPTSVDLISVPTKREEAIEDGWTKNNCFVGMGYHNFYKSEDFAKSDCLEIRPVFLLFNKDGDLHGFGFTTVGNAQSPRFEHPGPSALKSIISEDVAQCVLDMAETVKLSSMHVYFIERPYLVNCWF